MNRESGTESDLQESLPVASKASPAWVWLLALFTFGSFIETVFFGQLGAFTPLYLPHLGVAEGDVSRWTGIIAATAALLGLPFLPFWGALADRYARKPVILRSFLIEMASAALIVLSHNIGLFILARTLTSLSLGNSGLMLATLSERAPARRQGLAFSVMSAAGPVGAFVGPLIGGPIVDHWGFPVLMAIDGGLLVLVVIALGFGYKDLFVGTARGSVLRMAGDSVQILLQSRRLRSIFPALFVLFSGWMMANTYVPLAIQGNSPGWDTATIVGIILGVSGLAAMLVSPLMGVLADRHGYWRVLLIGAAIEVILWPIPAIVHGLFAFGIAWALINSVGSGVFALSFIVVSKSAEDDVRGRVMAFAYLPLNIGLFLGPALGSLLTQKSVFTVFPAAAILTASGIFLLAIAYRRH